MSESGVFRVSVPPAMLSNGEYVLRASSVEHLSEPPKPFGQPAWLRAGAVIMYAEPGIAELGIHYGDKCLSVPLSLRELEDLATAIDDALAVAQRKAES